MQTYYYKQTRGKTTFFLYSPLC